MNLLIKAILSLVLAVPMAWQELLAADGRRAPQQTASQNLGVVVIRWQPITVRN
ncbi:hypothetical protein D3C73_1622800 [compost metagenome]